MRRKVVLTDELKKAIAQMPPKEKDKLLFRFLRSHPDLVEKLTFELLEPDDNLELRRDELKDKILRSFEYYKNQYYSPGYLLLLLRDMSGDINRHVKATKDKYGEIELNFLMLNKSLELFGKEIKKATPQRSRTYNNYVVKRAIKLIGLLEKMHEDLRLNFLPALKELAGHIKEQPNMMAVANREGLELKRLG